MILHDYMLYTGSLGGVVDSSSPSGRDGLVVDPLDEHVLSNNISLSMPERIKVDTYERCLRLVIR
jgi:hypothetical protein